MVSLAGAAHPRLKITLIGTVIFSATFPGIIGQLMIVPDTDKGVAGMN